MNLHAEVDRMFAAAGFPRTDADRKAEAIESMRNRQRYQRQSAATKDGMRAELPEYEGDSK